MTPFWKRVGWAVEWTLMKMVGRDLIRRVTIGSRWSWRTGSSSKNNLRSNRKLPMIETEGGPGGSFLVEEDEDKAKKVRLSKVTQRCFVNVSIIRYINMLPHV